VVPADPNAPVCDGYGVGDGVTCVDASALHDEASALCAAEGRTLSDIWLDTCAGGGARAAKAVCCTM
jgi:hypothetical protein